MIVVVYCLQPMGRYVFSPAARIIEKLGVLMVRKSRLPVKCTGGWFRSSSSSSALRTRGSGRAKVGLQGRSTSPD
jgi:hypothetical protein